MASTPGHAQLRRGSLPVLQDDLSCGGRPCSKRAAGMGRAHSQRHGDPVLVLMNSQLWVGRALLRP